MVVSEAASDSLKWRRSIETSHLSQAGAAACEVIPWSKFSEKIEIVRGIKTLGN